jgi:Domain of unknown function (DUF4907)
MKKYIYLSAFLLFSVMANAQMHVKDTSARHPETPKYGNSKFEWKIIDAPNGTHGYEIYVDGGKDPLIHQTSIPSMPGNDGFKTKIDAQNCAKYIITKIQKGEFPPSVTPDELKKIKVLH